MLASKFALKPSKARSRLAFKWTRLQIALRKPLKAFARYEKDRKMKKVFLFSNTLSVTITAADVKALVDSFFLKPTRSVDRVLNTFVLTVPQQ